ncbi:GATOR complex protein MIOS [Condylostylus longicornis]|uniref:GATOR complex protein MIOS n=1 Tax=Condylostylus longicornis TaxID=2530218 RepID=UPI00244E24EE|nr:GATOR complex protein MIOS [Condylostylus longicornis]
MNGTVHGICCFPNISNKFISWGSEINLYEFKSSATPSSPTIIQTTDQLKNLNLQNRSSQTRYDNITTVSASLLTREDRYQYIRCIKPSYFDKPLIAVGLSSGKVGICDFEIDKVGNTAEEFIPRQQRTCLCLAWNEADKNILAIGHDKNRSDYCITIFDINRPQSTKDVNNGLNGIGLSDTAHSMCWDKTNRALIAGISQKTIRIYDLRSSSFQNASSTINTRFVNGLTLSQSGDYLASYVDSLIGIWDLRNLDKNLTQIQTSIKNISQISWCSTRSNVLSAMSRGAPYLQVFDIYPVDIENGNELYYTRKNFLPGNLRNNTSGVYSAQYSKAKTLVGFSWMPGYIDHALILLEDSTIEDFSIPHRTAMSIDPRNNLWDSYPRNNTNLKFEVKDLNNDKSSVDDISKIMRNRAIKRYGLLPDRGKNGETTNNPTLKAVWRTLEKITIEDNPTGLKNILGIDSNQIGESLFTNRSETLTLSWPELIKKSTNILTTYRNEARTQAQYLCGWDFDSDATLLNKFLPELCAKKEHTKAAMIAVFFLKISYACDILLKATDLATGDPSMLRMAAIALSSFDSDLSNNTWRQQQAAASSQIRDPHLRTIFAFLTIENENFDVILNEKGISLADRVAFACKYLNDNKLIEFIKSSIQKCIHDGDLNGLLLTGGECPETINLMQAYVDRSEDVQTVSLLAIEYFHVDEITDYRIHFWISSYLELLDIWGLWEKRAELEIKMNKNQSPGKTSRSVFLLCSFCGKSVSSVLTDDARLRNVSSHVNKLSSCPSCRKPLPRCSLCLLHMGTTTAISSQNSPEHESLGWQSKPFSKWFSWCQTCRHGGHTEHLMEWFQKNTECPVTGCSCKCFDMDLPVSNFPDEN